MAAAATPEAQVESGCAACSSRRSTRAARRRRDPSRCGAASSPCTIPRRSQRSERQLTDPLRRALEAARAAARCRGVDPARDAEALYHLAIAWLEARLGEPVPARREDAERLVVFALAGLRGMANLQAPLGGALSEQ